MHARSPNDAARRFACTACGHCCDRGPEMELGETAALASRFVVRAMFKVHSLPLYEHGRRAALWRDTQDSDLPLAEAIEEMRRHLQPFSAHDEIDKARGRSLHLTISALTIDDQEGRCPALTDGRCSLYAERPLACRSVPFHYSRPPSTLAGYLDRFTSTPGRACDTSTAAPVILGGGGVTEGVTEVVRRAAVELAQADGSWKRAVATAMMRPETADAAGLPSYQTVLENSDRGVASLVSMLPVWRLARRDGRLSSVDYQRICRDQAERLQKLLGRNPPQATSVSLQSMLLDYEVELAGLTIRPPVIAALTPVVPGKLIGSPWAVRAAR